MKIGSLHLQPRHFENTTFLAGNDHVSNIITSEDMKNISLCIFSILLSTI